MESQSGREMSCEICIDTAGYNEHHEVNCPSSWQWMSVQSAPDLSTGALRRFELHYHDGVTTISEQGVAAQGATRLWLLHWTSFPHTSWAGGILSAVEIAGIPYAEMICGRAGLIICSKEELGLLMDACAGIYDFKGIPYEIYPLSGLPSLSGVVPA